MGLNKVVYNLLIFWVSDVLGRLPVWFGLDPELGLEDPFLRWLPHSRCVASQLSVAPLPPHSLVLAALSVAVIPTVCWSPGSHCARQLISQGTRQVRACLSPSGWTRKLHCAYPASSVVQCSHGVCPDSREGNTDANSR